MTRRDLERRMWLEACGLVEEADRLHRRFFTPQGGGQADSGWEPPVDLYETEREVWMFAALPGVDPDSVELFAEPGALVIAGRRRFPAVARTARLQRVEIPHGRFRRRLALPLARLELAETAFENGCLAVRLLKKA